MATKTSTKDHSGIRKEKFYGLIYSKDLEEAGEAASRADVEEKAAFTEHAPATDSPSAEEKHVERSEAKPAQSRSAKKYKLCISVDDDIKEMLFVYRTLYPRKYRELTKKLRAIVHETLEEAYKRDKRFGLFLGSHQKRFLELIWKTMGIWQAGALRCVPDYKRVGRGAISG